MATRSKPRAVSRFPDKEERAWHELVHDVANELAALKLLLAAIGLADDDDERSRHLSTAKQTLVEAESRLLALREAMRRDMGGSSTNAVSQRSIRMCVVDLQIEHVVAATEPVSVSPGSKARKRPIKRRGT